jgi:hypothetical protein
MSLENEDEVLDNTSIDTGEWNLLFNKISFEKIENFILRLNIL